MGADNGMDASPSWQELKEERDAMEYRARAAEITRRVPMADTDRDEWMKPCRCTFAQKVVGDGCDICNPERAKEFSEEDDDDE